MSDADDQMGGTGGDRGLDPDKAVPGKDNAAPPATPAPRIDPEHKVATDDENKSRADRDAV